MKHIIWSTGHELILKDIVKAENCDLFDSKGNKYIDLESGVWCTSLGHSNPRINSVFFSQIKKIIHTGFNYCSPIIEKAALKVLEIANLPNGKCEFLCSGSEAVEYCVRLAKTLMKDKKLLAFTDGYFGAYGEASKRGDTHWINYNWHKCSCNNRDIGCIAECEEFSKIPFDQIGVFVFEPGSSSGLVKFPSKKLIDSISTKIKDNNGLLVMNEITTGVGRTGKWFGFQHYDLSPDMIAIGKGIGNGYPVSLAVVSEKVSDLLKNQAFLYAQSHQNDPLGASVVKEVIDTIIDENLIDRCSVLGEKLKSDLNKIKENNSLIKEIRGRGLMIAVEFKKEARYIHAELLKRGFVVAKRSGHEVIRIDPALTVKQMDIDLFLKVFAEIVEEASE
ncbi:MAG: aspartate aminotransferase family protein [Bacteroidales bacterium]|nr:aspartate aminotransferase family protein [Bacteroidales bacterium]MCF8391371.1 aspartate aminotransferase family protein [Bacteroidales bacterium]